MTKEELLRDIRRNPQNHAHTFDALQRCSMVEGVLDSELLEAHSKYAAVGMNGGRKCDTTEGPCSCGAFH